MRITAISDLHGHFPETIGGDLLIIAGDLTGQDMYSEYFKFIVWMDRQKYKHKVIVSGNHDNLVEKGDIPFEILGDTKYLCDSGIEIEGLKLWGSPWTLSFEGMNPDCKAFTCDSEEKIAEKFMQIPPDTDILITHSPRKGMLDETSRKYRVGSEALRQVFNQLKAPKLHVFGHIHEGYGIKRPVLEWCGLGGYPISINASHVNVRCQNLNPPINIEI